MKLAIIEKVMPFLDKVQPIDFSVFTAEEKLILPQLQFLSAKPLVYVANVIESQLAKPDENKHVVALKKKAQEEGRPVVVISAQIESELSVLDSAEKKVI